jgi:hypothetical protein
MCRLGWSVCSPAPRFAVLRKAPASSIAALIDPAILPATGGLTSSHGLVTQFATEMSKSWLSCILSFLFLLSFSPPAIAEPLFLSFETDPQVLLSADRSGVVPGIRHMSRPPNRLVRSKLPVAHVSNSARTTTPELCRRRWARGAFGSFKFSKSDVYQQLAVYRL